MRFNSPAEVVAWADEAAAEMLALRQVIHTNPDGTTWQIDANPYSTVGRRNDWQRGYDNAPPRSWEGSREYDTAFQWGAAYRRLLDGQGTSIPNQGTAT